MIAADPNLMADLLRVVGPVDTPAWPETITPDNVEQIMVADTFRTESPTRSDALQTAIGSAL